MIHPHTELKFINDEVGHGVVATQFIPTGTITWVMDQLDREFTPKQFQKMNALYQNILETYTFRTSKGNLVLCWDHGRFVNHSFKSNCISTAYDFEIAVRDIQPGEQLTDDYGYLNITEPFKAVDEGTKRKTVYPNDLEKYHQLWDKQLANSFPKIAEVAQPLTPLLSEKTKKEIDLVLSGKKPLASILELYYRK
ncbi:MAG TPA: SET domain-containing protein [Flavobacteriaceae bacterium]|nr:SET domain-containing protein [Flavobacteriaceae bacterium]HPF11637.1 SET domain-containing protein [Flavobacteriaceae bacterium]HQU20112.1 SET domain-containing protein [Flavobacteriaceae bacterium]HQU64799.1 SET domain-containing protein [Flavobacteriaceae bacterium]HRW43461.1 SET domain-containing protein [Flavobacteriaceae bacterium]